jgi:hypothetical protein
MKRFQLLLAVMTILSTLAACALAPTPIVVEKEVPVEKEVVVTATPGPAKPWISRS